MRRITTLILIMVALTGCTIDLTQFINVSQPAANVVLKGDAVHGEDIFKHGTGEAPPCTSCHTLGSSAFSLGPKLSGIGQNAGQRIPGMSAEEYLLQSIVNPAAFVVSGYRDIMYPQFGEKLTEQDIADLIAYLETL
jgi:cytochrome c2